MAEALPVIAIAAQVGGQLIEGAEGDRAARAQATVDEENARRQLLAGEEEALQTRRDERRIAGEMLAAMGGGGGFIGTGSAGDVIAESAYQRELEILNIRQRATGEANNLYQSAKDKRAAGRAAMTKAMFGAVSTALTGASQMRSQNRLIQQGAEERAATASKPVPRMRVSG